ncbi:hypothetical protein [Lapidilactobacillus gannanensis]|jgi:Ca2+/Na+ antiporter|uniref:Uncharacterized protein n=1 Tax=Lapidilactobacillus gannanensis TaxID=2486002 RepID=A0ABW4BN74_9LACO|nr:hypothetical protein [Lapidilactobacillus gannanensis]MCH4057776.1 hypothetical protein [Lactobacillaceae bacterium]
MTKIVGIALGLMLVISVYRLNCQRYAKTVLSLLLMLFLIILGLIWYRQGLFAAGLWLLGAYLVIYYLQLMHHKWQQYLLLISGSLLGLLLI